MYPPPLFPPYGKMGGGGKREERGGWVNKKLKREIFLLFSNNILLTICNVCLCCIKLSFQLGYLMSRFDLRVGLFLEFFKNLVINAKHGN